VGKARQQVLFVQRVPWGGGAERVVYDLAHALDRDRFEPVVVHLFQENDVPVSFDPAIPVLCVEPTVQELLNPSPCPREPCCTSKPHKLYQRLLSPTLRRRLRLRERLLWAQRGLGSTYEWLLSRTRTDIPAHDRCDGNTSSGDIASGSEARLNFHDRINAVAQPIIDVMPRAVALHEIFSLFSRDAILIPVMEEATIFVWLSQVFARRKYIASLHTVESLYIPQLYPDPQRRAVGEWLFAGACRGASLVTFPSEGCCKDLSQSYGVPPETIRVMPNPVDGSLIRRKSDEGLAFPIPQGKTVFVHAGRLYPEKGHALLIEACRILHTSHKNFIVLCLGKGALRDTLQSQINAYGLQNHVLLLGEVENPYPYMAVSRALILSSAFESFALVLVEAMLCGAVPVATDCPYGPVEVLDGGRFGLLVPPHDPRALAEAMLRITYDSDLHSELRARGQARALEYDITTIARQWEGLIVELGDKGTP
jgi:glycosyltransferase involved in cell wall biosynthesis